MKRLLTVLTGFLATPTYANGYIKTTQVERISVHANDVYVRFTSTLPGAPSCGTRTGWFWHLAFDATTAAGQNRLAALITAISTGRAVRAAGTGTCVASAPIEEMITIDLK